uniref:RanBP-type and C3HC4-type zinc finger-containing protein 1 n=1 Tax=Varanus komodoensis TaxID=61221 RepID=A0A8D2J1R9_VARKO
MRVKYVHFSPEELANRLSVAIEHGDEEEAMRCATVLAHQHATLRILLTESCYPASEIRCGWRRGAAPVGRLGWAGLGWAGPGRPLFRALSLVFQDYGFHPCVQRWIIGQCLCVDDRTVGSYGIRKDGDTAFLYLLSAKGVNLSEQRYKEDRSRAVLQPAALPPTDTGMPRSGPSARGWPAGAEGGRSALPPQAGWPCPTCTFINKPTRPGCEMCSADRPAHYTVPGSYKPDEAELWRMQQEEEGVLQYQKVSQQARLQNFQQLRQLDQEALVPNREDMECRICYLDVEPGKGVLLRECLHSFCRDCLRQLINCCEEPQVACPFRDDSYACGSHLQDREIRALVSWEEYERFLERRLAVAESRARNSYHCQTADCLGWCVCEDGARQFRCPVCQAHNCLACKAIHEGMTCKQYQEKLQFQAHTQAAARETSNMLKLGEAMHCPMCHIVVQKRGGCDWLRCPVCQTEICWVTKGPRWGPAGPGDTSGGCRCNVDGERCHPRCQNCH